MLYVTNCAIAHSPLSPYLIITISSLGPAYLLVLQSSSGLDSAPHTNLVALSRSVPCSHMGGRQTLSQESYFKSLCWTSSQALTRLSSMYIRKRMRSPQARLLVSCFRRLGLDLPLKPAGRESFCDSLGKPSCTAAYTAAQPVCTFNRHICRFLQATAACTQGQESHREAAP